MLLGNLALVWALVAAGQLAQPTVTVAGAPDTPVTLQNVRLLNAGASPLVLLYEAVNPGSDTIDTFTVVALTFDKDGILKARQVAPARRTLEPKERKFSAMVLDGFAAQNDHTIIVGVDQAQRAGSDVWWRADIRPIAEGLIKKGVR
jgi:hypothetical protein